MGFYDYKLYAQKVAEHARNRETNLKRRHILKKQAEQLRKVKAGQKAAAKAPYLDIPADMQLTREYVADVTEKRRYNVVYADYFEQLAADRDDPALKNVAAKVRDCHKHWFGDHYVMQRIFDVHNVYLCGNKFCSNCQHLLQASRLKRFTPILADLAGAYDFYHCVLTVPNCPDWQLKGTISRLFSAFTLINRYFSGDSRIRGVDFARYGYGGAVRCLECTVKSDGYHPHIHALLLLKKDLPLVKRHKNVFSYDRGIFKRSFSDLEILLQKMLYLLMNGEKVTAAALDRVPTGYSCTLDRIEGDEWKEVFKYVTKLTKDDKATAALDYDQFVCLYDALYRRRVLQGYGKLYNVAEDDGIDGEVEAKYYQIIETLKLIEEPLDWSFALDELLVALYKGQITCISKQSIQRYLNEVNL